MTRVIVVDDDLLVRTTVRLILEAARFEVAEVANGAGALQAMRTIAADLVICDLFMPGVDGIEVIVALRRDFPDVNVVAMSGGGFGGRVDQLEVARRLGAAETVEKPFTQQQLMAAVRRALGQPPDSQKRRPDAS